jgi:hypothetical protein
MAAQHKITLLLGAAVGVALGGFTLSPAAFAKSATAVPTSTGYLAAAIAAPYPPTPPPGDVNNFGEGYSDGYAAGYAAGFAIGDAIGATTGAPPAGQPPRPVGFATAYTDGWILGWADGYKKGYLDGSRVHLPVPTITNGTCPPWKCKHHGHEHSHDVDIRVNNDQRQDNDQRQFNDQRFNDRFRGNNGVVRGTTVLHTDQGEQGDRGDRGDRGEHRNHGNHSFGDRRDHGHHSFGDRDHGDFHDHGDHGHRWSQQELKEFGTFLDGGDFADAGDGGYFPRGRRAVGGGGVGAATLPWTGAPVGAVAAVGGGLLAVGLTGTLIAVRRRRANAAE